MKKIFVTMFTALTLSVATAQINHGAWIIGASSALGYNSYSYKGSSDNAVFNINTKSGYFVANNFALGLNLEFTSLSGSGSSQTITVIGAFTRYYLPKNFFLGIGVNSSSSKSSSGSFSSNSSSIVIPFELGIAAFITKNFAIEPSINYVKGDDKGGITYHGLDIGASSSIGLNLGFTLYLNRNVPEIQK